jgi:hypothetical protein
MVREQYLLLRVDEQHAVAAIPTLLAGEAMDRSAILELIRRIVWAAGDPSIGIETRFKEVEALLEGRSTAALPGSAGDAWKVVPASSLPPSRASGKNGRKQARDIKVRGAPDKA